MRPTVHPHLSRIALGALATLVAAIASAVPACGSDNQAPPSTTSSGSSTSSSGTTATGGSTTTTTTTSTGGNTGTGGGGTGGGTGGTGTGGGAPCVNDGGTTGCYSCPPKTNDQLLNACAPASDQCTHFDNVTRLPFWDGGALPPAP